MAPCPDPGGLMRNSNQVFVGPTAGAGPITLSGGHLFADTSNAFGFSIGPSAGQPGVFNLEAGTLTWQGDDLAEGDTFTAAGVVFRIG